MWDKRTLFDWLVGKAEELGPPFEKKSKKGGKFTLTPCQYAALFVLSVFFDMSEREVEQDSRLITEKHIDHSTFGKIIDRIPEDYMLELLAAVRLDLEPYLVNDEAVYLCDSTKVSLDRQYASQTHAMKERAVTKTDQVAFFVEYFPGRGVLAVNDVATSQFSDVQALAGFIDEARIPLEGGQPVFADRGFDGRDSLDAIYRAKLRCSVKLKKRESYRGVRWRARRDYDENGYKKLRGLVEAVFGGLATAGLDRTRFRKKKNIRRWEIAIALRQDIQTYMRLSASELRFYSPPWHSPT